MGDVPRLVIAAPHGQSGKTTVTLGLIAALSARGHCVQPFKKGPDYIDSGWLGRTAGRPCRNLDRFFMTPEQTVEVFRRGCRGAGIAVVEGNMGLYDGRDLEGSGSTAEVARILAAPVVLVVDATRMTRSAAALVLGFKAFDPGISIAGVILNKIVGQRHENMLRAAIEKYTDLPVLGLIPKNPGLGIPMRHLGLLSAAESAEGDSVSDRVRKTVEEHLDLGRLIDIAQSAPELPDAAGSLGGGAGIAGGEVASTTRRKFPIQPPLEFRSRVRVGYFLDEAFTFYYPENLEALIASGAELVRMDSLRDSSLPEVDGFYLGGGFPEMYAERLEANAGLRASVRAAIEDGMPVYAECGGLMYLCRKLVYNSRVYDMVGALPADVVMEDRPQGHGYTLMEVTGPNPFFALGTLIRGHEFHHSRVINAATDRLGFAYRVRRGVGIDGRNDGLVYRNVLAAYSHIHAVAEPGWAPSLVARAAEYRESRFAIPVAFPAD